MPEFHWHGPGDQVISLFQEDCLAGLRRRLPEAAVDVVVTSPPYNLGLRYGAYDDSRPREEYLAWLEEVALEIKRVLKDTGSFFLNVGGKPTDPWVPLDILARLRPHFRLQNVIHWIKAISVGRETGGEEFSLGHYKPIGGQRFLNDCHEYIFHLTKTGRVPLDRLAIGVPYRDKSNIGRWKAATRDKRCRGNTWFIPYETIRNRERERPHPATFPMKLPEMCLRLHGLEKVSLVLDPFLGLGTTALACMKLGLSCVGFEIDHAYFQSAVDRLTAYLHSQPLFGRRYGTL
jgi:site-specific DNA-methyltransferase (adenine-specific)